MNLKTLYLILNKELETHTTMEYISKFFSDNMMNKQLKDFKYLLENYDEMDYLDYIPKDEIPTENYKRFKIDELSNDKFELVLIYWNKHAMTKIHDHPTKGCLMKILEGSLDEHNYDSELKFLAYYKLDTNNISYIEKNKILHTISNNNDNIAISLHIYSPANYLTNYY